MSDGASMLSRVEALSETSGEYREDDDDATLNLSTASIRSSIYNYEEEQGRSYHAFRRGKYVFPNDEDELDRMDIHYHALRLVLKDRLWICPVLNPEHVLDVGTGTGIWAMDVADDYPAASVIGIDLSPTQPTNVPPNLEFQVMDADEDWDFNERFDLVHTRLMNGFSIRSWDHFYQQAFAHMVPGGWVENQEFDIMLRSDDGTIPVDGAIRRFENFWLQGIETFGLSARCYPDMMRAAMERAGFINVRIQPYKLPLGPWPKDKRLRQAGLYNLTGYSQGLSGISLKVFTLGLMWTREQLEVLLMEVRQELVLKSMHAYWPIYVVYGQKPPAKRRPNTFDTIKNDRKAVNLVTKIQEWSDQWAEI